MAWFTSSNSSLSFGFGQSYKEGQTRFQPTAVQNWRVFELVSRVVDFRPLMPGTEIRKIRLNFLLCVFKFRSSRFCWYFRVGWWRQRCENISSIIPRHDYHAVSWRETFVEGYGGLGLQFRESASSIFSVMNSSVVQASLLQSSSSSRRESSSGVKGIFSKHHLRWFQIQ